MFVIYVGDAADVVKRIRSQHCSGNVEGSACRRHVAQKKGYRLISTKRPSGTTRVRLNLPTPREGEEQVSIYIRAGKWRYCLCETPVEANDFQWYVIEKLNSLLNVTRKGWEPKAKTRYEILMQNLISSREFSYDELRYQPTGPGVYVLSHESEPK